MALGVVAPRAFVSRMTCRCRRNQSPWCIGWLTLLLVSCTAVAVVASDVIQKNRDLLRLSVEETHFPFLHGVASADPLEDSVLIWTRVSPPLPWQSVVPTEEEASSYYNVEWRLWHKNVTTMTLAQQDQLWESSHLVVQQGHAVASANHDYTVTIDVSGLQSDTQYYYQFQHVSAAANNHNNNNDNTVTRRSRIGSTRTIAQRADQVNVAVLSCTSLWSGYFNFYRHLAQQEDLHVVVHLGDFIYPELDPDELYRIPYGLCQEHVWFGAAERFHGDPRAAAPQQQQRTSLYTVGRPHDNEDVYVQHMMATFPHCDPGIPSRVPGGNKMDPEEEVALEQYRWMHQLYMMDPDLRHARAAHPFVVQFDNHDLGDEYPSLASGKGSAQAGFEWVPQRVNLVTVHEEEEDPNNINTNGGVVVHAQTFRHFRYGDNLLDLLVMDTGSYGGNASDKVAHGLLGQGQRDWLHEVLTNSVDQQMQWRILGSGKAFMPFTVNKMARAVSMPLALIMALLLAVSALLLSCQLGLSRLIQRRRAVFRQRTRSIEMDLLVHEANNNKLPPYEYDVGVGDDETEQDPYHMEGQGEASPMTSRRKVPSLRQTLDRAHKQSPPPLQRCTRIWFRMTVFWPLFWLAIALLARHMFNNRDTLYLFDNDAVTWTGQHSSVIKFFDQLDATNATKNNLWVTGDAHICYAADVFRYDPFTKDILQYTPKNDTIQRYGVEMLPCSGTRGNLDEMVGSLFPPLHPKRFLSHISKWLLHYIILILNRHFRYFNGDDHGYGLVQVTREQMRATFYQFPILKVTDDYKTQTMVVRDGGNKWE